MLIQILSMQFDYLQMLLSQLAHQQHYNHNGVQLIYLRFDEVVEFVDVIVRTRQFVRFRQRGDLISINSVID